MKNEYGTSMIEFTMALPFILTILLFTISIFLGLFNAFGAYHATVITLREIAVETDAIKSSSHNDSNAVMKEMTLRIEERLKQFTAGVSLDDIQITLMREEEDPDNEGSNIYNPVSINSSCYSQSAGNKSNESCISPLPDIQSDTFVSILTNINFFDFSNFGIPPAQIRLNTTQRIQESNED
jgi:hypothetical protein